MQAIISNITPRGLFNIYYIYDDYIELGFSNAPELFPIDLEDFDKIISYQWYPKRSAWGTYCNGYVEKQVVVLHRYLMNAELGQYVDHIDKNTLNTRKFNLRFITNQQNGFNRKMGKNNKSGIMGVHWNKLRNKWCARIKVDYRGIYLGLYEDFNEATTVRLKAEKEYFGEYAPQRDLFEQYGV
jgi:hypothetical protein